MDALYGPFKSATYARGELILVDKIKNRGIVRATRAAPGADALPRAQATLSLTFDDLATIVNGKDGDPLSMKPFDNCFTKAKIIQAWEKIGFVPFTRKCLENKKVRHELGQTDANEDLYLIQASYNCTVERAENAGINRGIFDAAISVAQPLTRPTDEDEQVRQLVAQKGAFSASALWNVCGTRVANSRVVIRAQREQMAIDDAKSTMVEQNRLSRRSKLLANAQQALTKHQLGQSPLTDKDWGDIV